MSRTLSTNRGSADSLKVSLRCGWSENARQMRCTVAIDKPEALAIERVLQWAAATGTVLHRQSTALGAHRVSARDLPATCPRLKLTTFDLTQLNPNRRSPRHLRLRDRYQRGTNHEMGFFG